MVDFENKVRYSVYDLEKIVELLRGPGGCPWDAEQTHESISRNFVEEVYEVVEAIDEKNPEHLCEELGDVLTQVVFHAGIEKDCGRFSLDDVADMVCKKLIFRHPHVFGDVRAETSQEVLTNWEELKRVEKKQDTFTASLEAVAKSLPALWRAEKVQKKAAKARFDWPNHKGAVAALREELAELEEAIENGSNVEEELGDILFAAVNVARFFEIDPEAALNKSSDKFISRFSYLEETALKRGLILENMALEDMDKLYNEAKKQ